MTVKLIDFNHSHIRQDIPQLKTGQVVKVYQKISETKVTGKKTETKERIQIFEGLIIAMRGKTGINATITVRKISGGIGVERIFPINAPTIEKIEIVKITKTRRAKLTYVRSRLGKDTKPKGELATEKDNQPYTGYQVTEETVQDKTTQETTPEDTTNTASDENQQPVNTETSETPETTKETA